MATGRSGSTTRPASDAGRDGPEPGFDGVPDAASSRTVTFTLIDTSATGDAKGSPIPGFDPIASGAVINLQEVGAYVSIRANPPDVERVGRAVFTLDTTYEHADEQGPFTLCGGDGAGGFTPCGLTNGTHSLTVALYSDFARTGPLYGPTHLEFGIAGGDYDGGPVDPPAADAGDEDADAPCCSSCCP